MLLVFQDKLMTAPVTEGSSGGWLFKNKEHGKASAAASLVMMCFISCLSCLPIVCGESLLMLSHLYGLA